MDPDADRHLRKRRIGRVSGETTSSLSTARGRNRALECATGSRDLTWSSGATHDPDHLLLWTGCVVAGTRRIGAVNAGAFASTAALHGSVNGLIRARSLFRCPGIANACCWWPANAHRAFVNLERRNTCILFATAPGGRAGGHGGEVRLLSSA